MTNILDFDNIRKVNIEYFLPKSTPMKSISGELSRIATEHPLAFKKILIEEGAQDYALTKSILKNFPQLPHLTGDALSLKKEIEKNSYDVFGEGKRILHLSAFKGDYLKKCPGISPGMVCCNYYVVNFIKNCIYDCSYCFLQEFLENNPVMTAYVNVEDLLEELENTLTTYPDRSFRVGTGELTDSLALDALIPYTQYLVPFFNRAQNAVLELKTKSDCVDTLLEQKDPTNVTVSWSINPEPVVESEEHGTASLTKRLAAAKRCQDAGFKIGFHIDPILIFPDWEKAYQNMIAELSDTLDLKKVEWVSLGSFRYHSRLKKIIKDRHPQNHLFDSEHVQAEDGKFRYLRPIRNNAYDVLRHELKKRQPDLNVYLCMETKEIWQGVTGKMPRADKNLDVFFDL